MSRRIRTLKPEWLDDEKLAALPDAARLLSIALILMADDHGRGRAAEAFVASQAWAYDPREGLAKAREGLASLSGMGYVTLYEVDGQRYYEIRSWQKHQRVDRPGKPRVPPPSTTLAKDRETLAKDRVGVATDLRPPTSDLRPGSTAEPTLANDRETLANPPTPATRSEAEAVAAAALDPMSPLVRTARGALVSEYGAAHEERFGQLFSGAIEKELAIVASWVAREALRTHDGAGMTAQAQAEAIAACAVRGLFALKRKPKWSWFAEDPAEYAREGAKRRAA